MTDDQFTQHDLGDAIQLDNAETLAGSPREDHLDAGWVPPDRPVALNRTGVTAQEQADGASLEERLREEEPDTQDAPMQERDPRAGRLVAPDEGAHADEESDAVAIDAGISGGAASAEEAAMHIEPER